MQESDFDWLLPWAAGFFDGEGSIGIARRNGGKSHILRCSMAQSMEEPIQLFKRYFGGWAYSNEGKRTPNQRPYWFWYAEARVALAMLRLMRPYLIVKADQADIGIEFYNGSVGWGNGRYRPDETEMQRREDLRNALMALHGGNGKNQPTNPWTPEHTEEILERRRQYARAYYAQHSDYWREWAQKGREAKVV